MTMVTYNGSRSIPAIWVPDIRQSRPGGKERKSSCLGLMNYTSSRSTSSPRKPDLDGKEILMTDKSTETIDKDGMVTRTPKPQASNLTFWIDPESIRSLQKSQVQQDPMGWRVMANTFQTAHGERNDPQSRVITNLPGGGGGKVFIANRICLSVVDAFPEDLLSSRPDAMVVLSWTCQTCRNGTLTPGL